MLQENYYICRLKKDHLCQSMKKMVFKDKHSIMLCWFLEWTMFEDQVSMGVLHNCSNYPPTRILNKVSDEENTRKMENWLKSIVAELSPIPTSVVTLMHKPFQENMKYYGIPIHLFNSHYGWSFICLCG